MNVEYLRKAVEHTWQALERGSEALGSDGSARFAPGKFHVCLTPVQVQDVATLLCLPPFLPPSHFSETF